MGRNFGIEIREVIASVSMCPECRWRASGDPPEFCEKCGLSMRRKVQIQICPFCGEDLDDIHLNMGGEIACDGDREVVYTNDGVYYVRGADGRVWRLVNYDKNDLPYSRIELISPAEAMDDISKLRSRWYAKIREADAAIQMM